MSKEHTLSFGKKAVRAIVIDDAVWFTAADLYGTQRAYTNKKALSCFGREHLKLHTFDTDDGPKRLTLVSALGALTIATHFARPSARIVDAWVRKQVAALGFSRPSMTLCADGTMPVRPRETVYEDREAWDELRREQPTARRRPPVADLPELAGDEEQPRVLTDAEKWDAMNAALLASEDEMLAAFAPTRKRLARKTR